MSNQILVLGDSHAAVFAHPALRDRFADYRFDVTVVPGATVSGLPNPNALTRAHAQFEEALASTQAATVITLLGEVDTGFVIWYRAQKYGEPIDTMIGMALENYQALLRRIRSAFRPIVISTPLPTIRDGMWRGDVANARREVLATQSERTLLTRHFNSAMAAFCEANAISFLALDDASMGEDGLVRADLRNRAEGNHHYDADAYAQLISERLGSLLEAAR